MGCYVREAWGPEEMLGQRGLGTRGGAGSERHGNQRSCSVRKAWRLEGMPGQRGVGTRGVPD